MKAYVAVTDNDWFRFLRARPHLDEVNFWQPGGKSGFKLLSLGQPFLFKLHYPENFVVGGGFFAHFSALPVSLAWDAFGEKNGAVSLIEMRERVERYRRVPATRHADYQIGCIILHDPFLFEEQDWLVPPKDFKRQIVQGKTYDLRSEPGKGLWEAVLARRAGQNALQIEESETGLYGDPQLVRQRLGQGTFRVLVTDMYERRCAVTHERALPVLEAAHIRPVSQGGLSRLDNGLLLRSDVHVLFDRGYVTVTPEYRFRVSRRLKDEFDNGEHYYQFDRTGVWVPRASDDRPRREFLEWHSDVVFRG